MSGTPSGHPGARITQLRLSGAEGRPRSAARSPRGGAASPGNLRAWRSGQASPAGLPGRPRCPGGGGAAGGSGTPSPSAPGGSAAASPRGTLPFRQRPRPTPRPGSPGTRHPQARRHPSSVGGEPPRPARQGPGAAPSPRRAAGSAPATAGAGGYGPTRSHPSRPRPPAASPFAWPPAPLRPSPPQPSPGPGSPPEAAGAARGQAGRLATLAAGVSHDGAGARGGGGRGARGSRPGFQAGQLEPGGTTGEAPEGEGAGGPGRTLPMGRAGERRRGCTGTRSSVRRRRRPTGAGDRPGATAARVRPPRSAARPLAQQCVPPSGTVAPPVLSAMVSSSHRISWERHVPQHIPGGSWGGSCAATA